MRQTVTIIGGGLAGAEAAWQAAQLGVDVELWEMRPSRTTPAHRTGMLAELVCSNSLRASSLENAVGLLKEEMKRLGSLVYQEAIKHQVPAGGALAVDRERFAAAITNTLTNHPRVRLVRTEVCDLPANRPLVIATGPLTSPALAGQLQQLTGKDYLYFYDAAAPIVTLASLDIDQLYWGSRYDKGEPAYLNAPMSREQYHDFYQALLAAEQAPQGHGDAPCYFEGCLPVEELAARGEQTLCYGPLKPVGLKDPRTGEEAYAVVQLRQDNLEGTLFNLVGFQTRLRWGEQERVFRLIPGLANAEFARFGVMHRNTYLNSPALLRPSWQFRGDDQLLFAGQLTGVEGYVESAASGLMAGINAARLVRGEEPLVFPPTTAHGALAHYVATSVAPRFQPMNITFGILPALPERVRRRRERNLALANRALDDLRQWMAHWDLDARQEGDKR